MKGPQKKEMANVVEARKLDFELLDRFVAYDRHHPHMYRNTVGAAQFIGWLPDDDGGPYEAPAPYVLSERQEAAEYHAEEYDLDRSMGRED